MFTGLIEEVGEVMAVEHTPSGLRLTLGAALCAELRAGDSVAVNGVCLTAAAASDAFVSTDVSPETLRASALGGLVPGALVNLERPLRADARLGGHFVLGHVDATGAIETIRQDGDFRRIAIRYPGTLAPYLVPRGSVAVDGISLTVAALRPSAIDVQIVPYTWAHTNLRSARPGDAVNLEGDVIGKYVVRLAELARVDGPAPSMPQGTSARFERD